jgi:Effector-associated domain 10
MSLSDELKSILDRIETGNHTATDLAALHRLLSSGSYQVVQQLDSKYNIHIEQGQNVQIGDCTYVSWNDEAIQALIQAIRADDEVRKRNYLHFEERCCDRQTLNQYLQRTLDRLKQQGCLDIQKDVIDGSRTFTYVARIADFEVPFGPISMRGDAFFLFSEFTSVQMPTLRQFSGQCLQWARGQVNPKAAGQAFYNFRMPTHLCFAIALVDQLNAETRVAIQTTNPIDHRVDILWYEVPVVYELSQKKLYFYDKPSNFFEQFKGEIVWKQLRLVIQQILMPSLNSKNDSL